MINPATEEVVTTAARGGAEDVALAVKAAKEAFDGGEWSHAKPSFRRRVLFKAADLIEARSAEIVARQTLEMGSPIGPDFGDKPHPVIEREAMQKDQSLAAALCHDGMRRAVGANHRKLVSQFGSRERCEAAICGRGCGKSNHDFC